MTHKTRVIVTVDDFGPKAEVNERAFDLIRSNLVTRVSAIVNIPWPTQTVERLKQSSVNVGLHLNISSGHSIEPPSHVPSLTDSQGRFLPENTSRNLSHICPEDIAKEYWAQLDCFYRMGLTLSHLDNHRSEVYFYPQLLDRAINLAMEEGVSFRYPLRNFSTDDMKDLAQKYQCAEKDILLLKQHYDEVILAKSVSCPDFFISDGSLGSFEKALNAIYQRNIEGCCEIAVHLEGDKGKANFDFILSERFQAWNDYVRFVKPLE